MRILTETSICKRRPAKTCFISRTWRSCPDKTSTLRSQRQICRIMYCTPNQLESMMPARITPQYLTREAIPTIAIHLTQRWTTKLTGNWNLPPSLKYPQARKSTKTQVRSLQIMPLEPPTRIIVAVWMTLNSSFRITKSRQHQSPTIDEPGALLEDNASHLPKEKEASTHWLRRRPIRTEELCWVKRGRRTLQVLWQIFTQVDTSPRTILKMTSMTWSHISIWWITTQVTFRITKANHSVLSARTTNCTCRTTNSEEGSLSSRWDRRHLACKVSISQNSFIFKKWLINLM